MKNKIFKKAGKHFTLPLIALFLALGVYLTFSLAQFYQAHKNFVSVNFDSVYNTRAMLKGRLLAEKLLAALQTARDYSDQARLHQAATHLDTIILQEKNFSYNDGTVNWLAPRLQDLQHDMTALQKEASRGPIPRERLEELIKNTRLLVRDMDDAERDSWGNLSAVNGQLNDRLNATGNQVAAIAGLFAVLTAILAWLLFMKAVAEARRKQAVAAEEIILERSPVGIAVTDSHDIDAVVVRANRKFAQMLEWPIAQLVGAKFHAALKPFGTQTVDSERLSQTLRAGEAFTVEGQRPRQNGRALWYRATCKAVDAGDLSKGIIWLYDDITERKQAEETLRENESHFRMMLDTSPIAVRITAADGHRVLFANQRYNALLNVDAQQVIGVDPQRYYTNPQDYIDTLEQIKRGEAVINRLVELRHTTARDGTTWHLASYFRIKYGEEDAIIGWFYDVSELRNANEELQLAYLVYRNSSEAMAVTNAEGIVITVNPAFTKLTGYAAEEIIGKNYSVLHSDRQPQAFYDAMQDKINASGHWAGEFWNRHRDGNAYAVSLTINSTYGDDGLAYRRVMLFSDITERKKSAELIWQQANFDAVTGLPNRSMFHDRLEAAIKKSHRTGLPLALMYIDLDRFKDVNDSLGHDMGDILLGEAARRLLGCVRETDTVARLGGDEFTVILSDLSEASNVERIAQEILQKLAEPFQLELETAYVSASLGITMFPDDGSSVDVLLKNADQAMYAAKSQGRNRRSYFTSELQQAVQKRMRLANDMRIALAGKQFRVHYQPIVDLKTGQICKAEALIRWEHPVHGLISPVEFIPIAEDTGMINAIGDWIFQETARQAARWRALYHPAFQISVNTSPVQFRDENFSHLTWSAHLRELGLQGQSIVVEITEGLLLDASPVITDKLLGFRDAGIQVALDDFGTGYSSLSYLKKFDIDYIKIDRSFVRNLAPGSSDMALSQAIIGMAHTLGLEVVAEGVETSAQRDLLRQAGCDYVQGFLYSKPVPQEQFEALLLTRMRPAEEPDDSIAEQ